MGSQFCDRVANNIKKSRKEKGELLIEINSILEVLPVCECQEIKDFILGVYLN